jgi:dipeptidyl aminopeptidase/acylaminoacyl peptidase
MLLRRYFSAVALCFFAAQLILAQAKRPLAHTDYDGWRTITSQHLSPDGKWLAYGLFPEEGDGEVVVRNLVSGQESRYPAGARPAAPPATGEEEGPPPQAPMVTVTFSADSRTLVFSTFPAKADVDKARKEKKTGDQAPKNGMVIVDLAANRVARIERVKRFQMPEKMPGFLAYLKEGPETAQAAPAASEPGGGDGDQQRGGRGGRGGAGGGGARPQFGSDLVLRVLADGSERTFADVTEFSLADDAKQLIFAVGAHDTSKNGVFAAQPGTARAPSALLAGKGKYANLTWDEEQTELAFLSDRDDSAAKQAKWKLYLWNRQAPAAGEAVSSAMPGFHKGWEISEHGNISFSKDGKRLFFGCAPPSAPAPAAADSTDGDKAVVDVWNYKDDYIQPIQKVRAARDRNRTFTAVFLVPEHKLVQLGDETLSEITPSESAQWALGVDDREYRRMADYDEHYSDAYLVNLATGERKEVAWKDHGSVTWSPGGRYLMFFDGKDWNSISVPDGKTTNLTAKLPVKFWNEETDTPSTPAAYGLAGWTKDGRYVLVYDHYDIWRVAPDGSGAQNLTAGYGRAHDLRFLVVRQETEARERWMDSSKPLLLHAENLKSRDTGYFRASWDAGEPRQLVMAAKFFAPQPVKAKDADVYLLTGQTFSEFPDLLVTDGSFKEMRKVSHANPQQDQLLWGTSELMPFQNADGVPLQAVLYKPENFDPHKKYPMMVYIYERLTQNLNHFVDPRPGTSINISFYVSRGYLVLTPDIVYTVGYPGQSALKCVLPAVQAVVDRGFVDEKAIGIQGHSWGGYQIAYMVTQTNRFRAVEAGAPVANMISAYDGIRWGTGLPRQFQYERTQSRIGGSVWQYPTRFIENSPIFWADHIQTPVMIIANDGDTAVPWYQGIEFYLALRRLGKEVYLFDYNGEPHGLQKRPNQKDYTIRLQQYFDHYLKGAPAPEWMVKGVPYVERERTELEKERR